MQARSLYLHFPFCESKCHYCDFYSLGRERTRPDDAARFEAALSLEAARAAPLLDSRLETIFMGGGTPSMTDPDSMARALEPLWKSSRTDPSTEWTMEANPSSVDPARLRAYRGLGVNRISMGVQALRPDLLEKLGRVHSRERALGALSEIFEAGFENVSVDLLCGVPGQSRADLDEALDALLGFPITHLSCYLLTLPQHHRMHRDLPGEDEQLAHLLHIDRRMTEAGFEHYEISNFARPGKRARHNLAYWKGESYLGLGPSAHSFDAAEGRRWKNVSSIHRYAELLEKGQSVVEWSETLSTDQRELERWMLALRLSDGFPASWLKPSRSARLSAFRAEGLVQEHPESPDRFRLTPRGFAVSDHVIAGLI